MAIEEREPLLNQAANTFRQTKDVDIEKHIPEELQGWSLGSVLAMPLLGVLLVALDVTLTSTISASVAADFSSLSIVSWLGCAYLVAMTIVQSLAGSLSDRFGRYLCFMIGVALFAAGNLVCGLATDANTLIAARAVAGAGGGVINSITTFVTSDLVPIRRRPVWQGLGNVAWAVGMGSGGVLGGFINDFAGWRWAFIILMPMTVLVGIGAYFTFVRGLPNHDNLKPDTNFESIDLLGSSMLSGMLICLVLGLNLMEHGLPKDIKARALTFSLLGMAGLFLVALLIVEKWVASNPVIPLHLLANRSVSAMCLAGFFLASSLHTLLYYVPLLIQVQGYSTSEVGLQILGEPLGASIGPFLVGLLIKELGSYAVLKPVSWAIYIIAPIIFVTAHLSTPVWVIVIGLVAMGAGFGSVLTVNLTGLLANVDQSYQAKATAMAYVFRQSGASVGLAVAGLIFRARIPDAHGSVNSGHVPGNGDDIATQCSRHGFVGHERPAVCVGYANALHGVYSFTLITGLIGFGVGMLIRNVSLTQDVDDGKLLIDNDSE